MSKPFTPVAKHGKVFIDNVLPKSANFHTFRKRLAMFIWTHTLAYLPRMAALVMASTFKSFPNLLPTCLGNSR